MLMLRSQTPLKVGPMMQNVYVFYFSKYDSFQIRAGGIFPMTLEAFQSLLNATYTYFTMLKGMMAK